MTHNSLIQKMMASPTAVRLGQAYRSLFSIDEIAEQPILQWLMGALIINQVLMFQSWFSPNMVTIESAKWGEHLCWSYFQSCGNYYFLSAPPWGFTQQWFYAFTTALAFLSGFCMFRKRWGWAHFAMLLTFVWEFLVIFVLSRYAIANYNYYHVIFMFVLLIIPHKLAFARLVFVALYFFAGSLKIHEGWILGTYFSPIKAGLPLVPFELIPFATWGVLFLEIILPWFLFHKNGVVKYIALASFVMFHLYSGLLVNFRYPTVCTPMLLILFGQKYTPAVVPLDRRSLSGWMTIGFLLILQMIGQTIPGDEKMTLEGNEYGLFMFEANHQCVSYEDRYYANGSVVRRVKQSRSARNRCNPFSDYFRMKHHCKKAGTRLTKIRWRFDHTINGGPFYRIVDVDNACTLQYKSSQHNDWIQLPEAGAPVVGYPVQNVYE